jgi:hypothetical protein
MTAQYHLIFTPVEVSPVGNENANKTSPVYMYDCVMFGTAQRAHAIHWTPGSKLSFSRAEFSLGNKKEKRCGEVTQRIDIKYAYPCRYRASCAMMFCT